jgi:hypothetical protein
MIGRPRHLAEIVCLRCKLSNILIVGLQLIVTYALKFSLNEKVFHCLMVRYADAIFVTVKYWIYVHTYTYTHTHTHTHKGIRLSLVDILRFNLRRSDHTKRIRGLVSFHNAILINYTISLQIFVHTSCESLYQHVTKDALPKEYGGNLDSTASYHSKLHGTSTIDTTDAHCPHLLCLLGEEQGLKCNFRILSLDFHIYWSYSFICVHKIMLKVCHQDHHNCDHIACWLNWLLKRTELLLLLC